MRVLDPGHSYLLSSLDGGEPQLVEFVKREGPGYPGNYGHHGGTTLQECWRMEIDRLKYLDSQEHCSENVEIIQMLRRSISLLEERAARRHGRVFGMLGGLYVLNLPEGSGIEAAPCCPHCLHIGCGGSCLGWPDKKEIAL